MPEVWSFAWLLSVSRYTTTHCSTMTKQLRLPGISLRIEECTQCGASSGVSKTPGESMATGSLHLSVFSVPVSIPIPVSIPAFLYFPVALLHAGHCGTK